VSERPEPSETEPSETGEPAANRPAKGATAFRTIGEVADDLDLPAHVLRFWESKFPQLKPLKRGGGRRYYRPEDVVLLRRIRQCLYHDGYTIRGVQKLLGVVAGDSPVGRAAPPDRTVTPGLFPFEAGADPAAPSERPPSPERPLRRPRRQINPVTRAALEEIRRELLDARELLAELMRRSKGP
jgi:DNA-binding transcriptional MerR regulator